MPARLITIARGRYKVRWRDGTRNPETKRLIERSTGVIDLATAKAEMRRLNEEQRLRRELKRGAAGRVVSLDAILALWSRHVLASKIARQAHADEVQRVLGALFKRRKWANVVDVTPEAVATWRSERGGRGTDKPLSMLKNVLRYARAFLKQPVDLGALEVPGRRGVRRRAQPQLLTDDQVAQVIARARERGGRDGAAIIEHLATYGCRPIDACRLRVRDFNAVTGMLTLSETKNGETVVHPLQAEHVALYRELADGRSPNDRLFLNPYGEPWAISKSASQLLDWYTSNVSEHLLPRAQWGLYLLKDFAISAMDRAGIDDRTKALFTGHRSLAVFERYKATNLERARDALSALARPAKQTGTVPDAPQVRPPGRKTET